MARLNLERQKKIEPQRMDFAKQEIEALGYVVTQFGNTRLEFEFKGHTVRFYPYSGWASGASIIDGRGFLELYNQINQ